MEKRTAVKKAIMEAEKEESKPVRRIGGKKASSDEFSDESYEESPEF